MNREMWQVGQRVSRPKIVPYTIAELVGEAGNIHISRETHGFHVYWHKERPNGGSTLVHHGGPGGFKTLQDAMHQHERVILRYTGLTVEIPSEQESEISAEEQKTGIPSKGQTLPEIIGAMQTLFLPGEQHKLGNWISILQDANRDIPQTTNHGQLANTRGRLDELKGELKRTRGVFTRKAVAALETGLIGSRGELLSGSNEAQVLILQRAQQTVSIVVGTMKRYNDLESLQIYWNRIVEGLPGQAGYVFNTLKSKSGIQVERAVGSGILGKDGLEAKLQQLKGEPYYGRAQEIIDALSPLRKLWEAGNIQKMEQILASQTVEMEIWKRRVMEQFTGVNFGKYKLS